MSADLPDWPDDKLLTASQVAPLLGIDRRTLVKHANSGKIPAYIRTPGGHRRFRWKEIRHQLLSQMGR